MIVTTGKRISIELAGGIVLERDCKTPGGVRVTRPTDGVDATIWLPTNVEARSRFIAAYERICAEEIEYRKQEVE